MSDHRVRITGLALTVAAIFGAASPPAFSASPRHGAHAMLEPYTASLLVDYFEAFLRDKDIEAFHRSVASRYTEGTLARMTRSGSVQARRAAFLALGLEGGFRSNEVVARGMRDPDSTVRNLAQNALWAIWFRADTPENNATLDEVRDLISRNQFAEAVALADVLLGRAPEFAEAHNQKAIALFFLDQFEVSARACQQVLKRNPYHTGALAGLGQCYLRLDQTAEALATFRRALRIQPYNESLKQTVASLEEDQD